MKLRLAPAVLVFMSDNQLRIVMHALTLADRPEKREVWLKGGFKKMHARGKDALHSYWKNRVAKSPEDAALFQSVWSKYLDHMAEASGVSAKGGAPVRLVKLPSLVQQAKNFASASVAEAKAIARGNRPVTPQEQQARLAICAGCPFILIKEASGDRCSQCGCFLNAKTAWRSSFCPVGNWAAILE